MTRKVTTRKTPEERRAQAESLQASIAEQVEQLRGSEQWQRFLDFARSFHGYSLPNLLLILDQCPTATYVAGFRQWQEKGRQVRKGEKAIRIFGFRQKKVTDEEAPEGEESGEANDKGERVLTYYPVLSVFDISQTDLADAGDPSQIVHQLDGDEPQGILTASADWLTGQGWSFEREQIQGSVNGYTTTDGTQRVVVDADLSPVQAAKLPSTRPGTSSSTPTRTTPNTSSIAASRKPRPRAWPTSSPDSWASTPAPTASATSPDGATATPRSSRQPPHAS